MILSLGSLTENNTYTSGVYIKPPQSLTSYNAFWKVWSNLLHRIKLRNKKTRHVAVT